jgi:hypothetical protein
MADAQATDALDVLADAELSAVEVDQLPGEPEELAPALARGPGSDVSGMQHIDVAAGGLEELAGLIYRLRAASQLRLPAVRAPTASVPPIFDSRQNLPARPGVRFLS